MPLGHSGGNAAFSKPMEVLTEELAMETIAKLYLLLPREWKWPKVNVAGLAQPFGEALELYRSAVSAAYLTACSCEKRDERLPDVDLDGRDPRW